MIVRQSTSFQRTLRQAPAEAETDNHALLLRAGLVDQLASGIYSYLPMGWRVLRKIEQIIREEMDAAGGQELMLPVLHPIELWEQSGRRQAMGQTLFVLTDRRERELALGPTHEEVISEVVKQRVQSYRDLPLRPYQIQSKFRDEARPRGGLIRVRQFTMKDLYSFDTDWDTLDVSYQAMRAAYKKIFDRCGVPTIAVHADSGAIGGKDSQEFLFLTEIGEDTVLLCPNCGYAANAERADFRKEIAPAEEALPTEVIDTPGMKTIESICVAFGVPRLRTAKAVFYLVDGQPVFVVVRGDHDVNEIKLKNALKAADLRFMEDNEVQAAGFVAGSASPWNLSGVKIVTDDIVPTTANLIGGANLPDKHVRNLNYGRDWTADLVADIALAREGSACIDCGTGLEERRRIGEKRSVANLRDDGLLGDLAGSVRRYSAERRQILVGHTTFEFNTDQQQRGDRFGQRNTGKRSGSDVGNDPRLGGKPASSRQVGRQDRFKPAGGRAIEWREARQALAHPNISKPLST